MNVPPDNPDAGMMAKAALAARLLVGAVLVFSGLSKLMVPAEEFALALETYRLFPLPMIMALAQIIPWLELCTGFFLLLGFAVDYAGTVAAVLFGAFITALGSTLVRGIPIEDCGCFGWGLPHLSPSRTILLDSAQLLLCLVVLADRERRFSLERLLRKKSRPPASKTKGIL
jgi:uncharacterized membrane protein YphA (DoxX/SURF4 family)